MGFPCDMGRSTVQHQIATFGSDIIYIVCSAGNLVTTMMMTMSSTGLTALSGNTPTCPFGALPPAKSGLPRRKGVLPPGKSEQPGKRSELPAP